MRRHWSLTHTHLLCRHQNNCGDTDHSHRHLLCKHQYNCGDTDLSHRHLLCKRQNNCGDTDMSHRHLLCKHQYNCRDTEISHRHLLCKHHLTAATQITHTDTSSANANITAATQIAHTDTSAANTNITTATQIIHTDNSAANTKITAVTQICHTDTAAANTNITAATQIAHTDTSAANINITAATQIAHTNTSAANTNITAATQITRTDTSSANTNITAATQIAHTDTSAANTNITAATQITRTDTSSANTNITAATQITHTDTSSANTNITAATQIAHTDTSAANTNITAATRVNLTRFRDHSRCTRHCGEPYGGHANGCERLRTQTQLSANTASPPDPQMKREPSLRIRENGGQQNGAHCWAYMFSQELPQTTSSDVRRTCEKTRVALVHWVEDETKQRDIVCSDEIVKYFTGLNKFNNLKQQKLQKHAAKNIQHNRTECKKKVLKKLKIIFENEQPRGGGPHHWRDVIALLGGRENNDIELGCYFPNKRILIEDVKSVKRLSFRHPKQLLFNQHIKSDFSLCKVATSGPEIHRSGAARRQATVMG